MFCRICHNSVILMGSVSYHFRCNRVSQWYQVVSFNTRQSRVNARIFDCQIKRYFNIVIVDTISISVTKIYRVSLLCYPYTTRKIQWVGDFWESKCLGYGIKFTIAREGIWESKCQFWKTIFWCYWELRFYRVCFSLLSYCVTLVFQVWLSDDRVQAVVNDINHEHIGVDKIVFSIFVVSSQNQGIFIS